MNRPQYQQTPTSASTWTNGSGTSKNYGYPSATTGLTGGVDVHRLPSRKLSQGWKVLLWTGIGTSIFIFPLAAWLWWIFVHETTTIDRQNLQLYSTANATRLLLVSSASVTLAKIIVGPLMAIHAHTAAIDWLNSSDAVNQNSRLPTPIQLANSFLVFTTGRSSSPYSLGTLSSIYSGARLLDIISALQVWARSPKHLRWPKMLTRAICLLTWLVLLSAAVAGVDLWLHFDSSSTTNVPTSTNFAAMGYNPSNMLYSRTINETLCASENQRSLAVGSGSCGLSEFVPSSYVSPAVRTNNLAEALQLWLTMRGLPSEY